MFKRVKILIIALLSILSISISSFAYAVDNSFTNNNYSLAADSFAQGVVSEILESNRSRKQSDAEKQKQKQKNIQRKRVQNLRNNLIDRSRSDRENRQNRSARVMRYNLDYAVAKVRRKAPGKVVGAKTAWRGNEAIHSIRILTEGGRVRTIRVSGTSGQFR